MKGLRLLGLLVVSLVLVVGCTSAGTPAETSADIRGTVTDLFRPEPSVAAGDMVGSLLIEGTIEEDTEYDRAFVSVTEETQIFEQVGQSRRPADFEALAVGQRVEARFLGPVMESYPVQATAVEIVILR
jgi:hypothetical protein